MNPIPEVSDFGCFPINLVGVYMDDFTYHGFSKVLIPNLKEGRRPKCQSHQVLTRLISVYSQKVQVQLIFFDQTAAYIL